MEYEFSIIQLAKPIIIHYKEHREFEINSAFTASIGRLTGRMTFVRNNPTYIELLSSGNIDIISSDSLKNKLINYYQQMERMEQIINKNNNLFTDAVFIPNMLQLSEVQLSSIYYTDLSKNLFAEIAGITSDSLVDLNEDNLKAITRSQLKSPEKQLLFINAVNFRYQLSIIHYSFLFQQQKRTEHLIDLLKVHD